MLRTVPDMHRFKENLNINWKPEFFPFYNSVRYIIFGFPESWKLGEIFKIKM